MALPPCAGDRGSLGFLPRVRPKCYNVPTIRDGDQDRTRRARRWRRFSEQVATRRGPAGRGAARWQPARAGVLRIFKPRDLAGETVCVGEATTYLVLDRRDLYASPKAPARSPTCRRSSSATRCPPTSTAHEAGAPGRTDDVRGLARPRCDRAGRLDEGLSRRLVGQPSFNGPLPMRDISAGSMTITEPREDAIVGQMQPMLLAPALSERAVRRQRHDLDMKVRRRRQPR